MLIIYVTIDISEYILLQTLLWLDQLFGISDHTINQPIKTMSENEGSRRPSRMCDVTAVCELCGGSSARFICSKCRLVSYCSIDCQTANWKIHKKKCKSVAQQEEIKEASRELWNVSFYGNMPSIRALLVAGVADVHYIQPDSGTTALVIASQNGHVEAVRALVAAGGNVNHAIPRGIGKPVNEGGTALELVSQQGHVEVVRILVSAGANVNHANKTGATALFFASQDGHIDVVKLLIAASRDVNHANLKGNSPLIYASENGHVDVVKLLIAASADVNHAAINGVTPLTLASESGHVDVVKLLIAASGDVNHFNFEGGEVILVT